MGYLNPDPYSQPEAFGLVPVAMVDWYGDEGCYEFSVTQVWFEPKTRLFWWAYDSGCSCNAPFEYFEEGDINKGSWSQVIAHLNSSAEGHGSVVKADVADCVAAIMTKKNEG